MEVIIPYPRLVLLLEGLKEVMWVWSQVKSSAQRGSPAIMQVYSRALFVTVWEPENCRVPKHQSRRGLSTPTPSAEVQRRAVTHPEWHRKSGIVSELCPGLPV